jgi:hypothetical protein
VVFLLFKLGTTAKMALQKNIRCQLSVSELPALISETFHSMSYRSSLTLNGFEVLFELVFQVPVVKKHFHSYLKAQLNEEGFLFCYSVDEFKNTVGNEG